MAAADPTFAVLSDPVRLPDYVPVLELVESVAIAGEDDADANLAEREGAPGAAYEADTRTRTMRWGQPDGDYHGSITVAPGTASTSTITIRLHTRDDLDGDAVAKMLDAAVSKIRVLTTRR
jgi:hypothetical protein